MIILRITRRRAMRERNRASDWTAKSLALHTQVVIQGAFILAKATGGAEIAADRIDHLRRDIEMLFGVGAGQARPQMETQNEKDQDLRTHLTGRRDLARRTERRQRLRAWRMDGTLSNSGRGSGRRRGTGQELRSAARPPHLRSLGRLLAEGAEQSDRGRSERRDEIRRDPQAGESRMGSGWRPRRGHHGRYSRHQVEGRPRPDRLGKYDPDVRAVRAGAGRRGGADRLPGL